MAHFLRVVLFALAAALALPALADGGPFPATTGQWDTSTCNSTAYPASSYDIDSPSWTCTGAGGVRNCGYNFVVRNSGGTQGYVGVCTQTKGADTCPDGANLSTVSGASVCTCTAGLRPSNGQCTALPQCPDGQHEEGGACVPDNCKANETRVNGVCVPEPPCPAGQSRVNGVCKPFKCPTSGTVSDQWFEVSSVGQSSTCLYNDIDKTYCVMTITPSVIASAGGNTTYMGGYGVYTGGKCGPSEPGKPTPTDPDKPEGDPDKGTKPPGPDDPKPGDKPGGSIPPGGGGGGPGSNGTNPNPDGSCPPGYYKSGGNCYLKDPPKQPPDSNGKCPFGYVKIGSQCIPLMPRPDDADGDGKDDKDEEGSSFGGQCESVSCEGDAIQCAIVRDQYKRSCEAFEKESAESKLYSDNKGKEGKQTGDLPGNETVNVGGRIDSSDALGGGSAGLSDLNVTVWGQSISLPISMLNPYLAALGNVLLAVSFLLALRIVARG